MTVTNYWSKYLGLKLQCRLTLKHNDHIADEAASLIFIVLYAAAELPRSHRGVAAEPPWSRCALTLFILPSF